MIPTAGGVLVPGGRGSAKSIVNIKIITPLEILTGMILSMKVHLGLMSFSTFIKVFLEEFKNVASRSPGIILFANFFGKTGSQSRIIKILKNAMTIPKTADNPKVGIGNIKGQDKNKVRKAFPLVPNSLIRSETESGPLAATSIRFCKSSESLTSVS